MITTIYKQQITIALCLWAAAGLLGGAAMLVGAFLSTALYLIGLLTVPVCTFMLLSGKWLNPWLQEEDKL